MSVQLRNLTLEELASAFTEWDRRYREDPEAFEIEWLSGAISVETYGEMAATYLLGLLEQGRVD